MYRYNTIHYHCRPERAYTRTCKIHTIVSEHNKSDIYIHTYIHTYRLIVLIYYSMDFAGTCICTFRTTVIMYCIVSIHLYSASCSENQSEALPVRETQREEQNEKKEEKECYRNWHDLLDVPSQVNIVVVLYISLKRPFRKHLLLINSSLIRS